MSIVIDAVAEGRLDGVAVIHLEGRYLHPVLLIDDSISLEILGDHRDPLRRKLLVLGADLDVERIGLFQIRHELPGAGRADDPKWLLPPPEDRAEPPRQPDIRNAGGIVSVKKRKEEHPDPADRHLDLAHADRNAAPGVEQKHLPARFDQGARTEAVDPRRGRGRTQQRHPEVAVGTAFRRKAKQTGRKENRHDCAHWSLLGPIWRARAGREASTSAGWKSENRF